MKIAKLRVNHLENPLGFSMERAGFSWIVTESRGKRQDKARIEISLYEDFRKLLYDSGPRSDISSLGFYPEISLFPRTRYFWRVTVWDDRKDQTTSETAWFETAKQEEEWEAKWLTPPFEKEIHPLFLRSFRVEKRVRQARAYACGLGVFELYLNEKKVGDEVLAPFYHDYNHWLQYLTYDLAPYLCGGENRIIASLGNGWYKGRFGFLDGLDELYGDRFLFLCEIRILYEDGSCQVIGSDESWKCCPSPVQESSIYDGEVYDARLEPDILSGSAERDSNCPCIWQQAQLSQYAVRQRYTERLKARLSPRLLVKERLKPKELLATPAGETVLDFGQNMTGVFAFLCHEKRDRRIRISCGEILQKGNFYNENLRTARGEYCYICDGKERLVHPYFTFYGFRYLKIEGMTKVSKEDFEGWVIYSDLETTGKIETSDPKVNRLFLNTLWGQKGNFLDVPTDCPQRDERMGWTGDAQVFASTACYHMYTPAFYHKYLYDMLLEQQEWNGSVPHVVPDIMGQIMRITYQEQNVQHGSCAWGDAACVIPWTLYVFYGDKELLRQHYANMKFWVEYIRMIDRQYCGNSRLWKHGFHFADWLALDNPGAKDCVGSTDPYYVASAYYFYSTTLLARAAEVLGYTEDVREYGRLAKEIKEAIGREYFTPDKKLKLNTQTAYVLALYMGFAPEGAREGLTKALLHKLEENRIHLDTGFVGTPYLCPVLSEQGCNTYAYTLLLNEDYPSWLYEVNMGATTIWERWNSVLEDGSISDTGMNSLNHYAYGSIGNWMYGYLCGLRPLKETGGFKRVLIAPMPEKRIQWVKMEYLSAAGNYRIEWKWDDGRIKIRMEIPFDAEAIFVLPEEMEECILDGEKITGRKTVLTCGEHIAVGSKRI